MSSKGTTELLRSAQTLSTAYLGLVNRLFAVISVGGVTRAKLATLSQCDAQYVSRWIDAATEQGLITTDHRGELQIMEQFSDLANIEDSIGAAQTLQAVFSVLVVDSMVQDFRTGFRAGYSLVERFPNLVPYYGALTESLYGSIFDLEALPAILATSGLADRKLSVLDFGCGSGWLLRRMRQARPHDTYVGAGPSQMQPASATGIFYIEISAVRDCPQLFDVIIVNKVLHHLGDELYETLRLLRKRLAPEGLLVVWEFSWPPSVDVGNRDDRAFLNLVEHAQGAGYIAEQEMLEIFRSCGLLVRTQRICNSREVLYLAHSSEVDT